jgi:hypothetical protein
MVMSLAPRFRTGLGLLILIVGLGIAAREAAAAEPPESGLFVTAGIGYGRGEIKIKTTEGDRKAEDHGLGNGVFRGGFHLAPHLIWELGYNAWDESDGSFETGRIRLVSTTVAWLDPEGLFLRGGFGWGRLEATVGVPADSGEQGTVQPRSWSDEALALIAGVGYRHFFTDWLGVAGELNGAYLKSFGDMAAFFGSIGVSLILYPL